MELDQIAFQQIQRGYWTIVVNGTVRPIVVIRQGRNWVVQMPLLDPKVPGSRGEVQVGSTRNLRDAKGLMVAAWLKLDTARELGRWEANEIALDKLADRYEVLGVERPTFHQDTPQRLRIAYMDAHLADLKAGAARHDRAGNRI